MSDKKPKSRTERDTNLGERIFSWLPHFKTTISNGQDRVERHANSASEAERRATKAWQDRKKK